MIINCNVEEVIKLGDDVELKILEVRGRQVCIGVTAPRSTPVYREEIYDRAKQKNSD